MRIPVATALALAVGLMAAPGFARTTNSPVGKVQTSTTSTNAAGTSTNTAGTMRSSSSHHRITSRHHGTHMASANPTAAEHARVEQLNNMSLQSAKRGQSMPSSTGQK